MYNLTDQLRAAAAVPPPTSIDLDSLIAAQQRRSRVLRWGDGIATAFALVAALTAAPLLTGEGGAGGPQAAGSADGGGVEPTTGGTCPTPGPNPTGNPGSQQSHPAPRPAEACGAAVQRLTGVLTKALRASAPDVAKTPHEPTMFVYSAGRLRYEALLELTGPSGPGYLRMSVTATHERPDGNPECGPDLREPTCSYEVTPGGTILLATDLGSTRKVLAYLADGTTIAVYCYGRTTTRRNPPRIPGRHSPRHRSPSLSSMRSRPAQA